MVPQLGLHYDELITNLLYEILRGLHGRSAHIAKK